MTDFEYEIARFLQDKVFVEGTNRKPITKEAKDWFEENKSKFMIVPTPTGTKSTIQKDDIL